MASKNPAGLVASRRYNRGEGPSGIRGRFKYLLGKLQRQAKQRGYEPPRIGPDGMASQWKIQNGACVACLGQIRLLSCVFDHNHETGEPRGFVHKHCNMSEGWLAPMTNSEFDRFIKFVKKVQNRA